MTGDSGFFALSAPYTTPEFYFALGRLDSGSDEAPPVIRGPATARSVEVRRSPEGRVQVDQDEPLRQSIRDRELPEAGHELHRLGRHERARGERHLELAVPP